MCEPRRGLQRHGLVVPHGAFDWAELERAERKRVFGGRVGSGDGDGDGGGD